MYILKINSWNLKAYDHVMKCKDKLIYFRFCTPSAYFVFMLQFLFTETDLYVLPISGLLIQSILFAVAVYWQLFIQLWWFEKSHQMENE